MTYTPQVRVIQNRGVLIPTDEESEALIFLVFMDVLASPVQISYNFRHRIPKTFFGNAQLLWKRRVIANLALEYFNQLILVENRSIHQIACDIKCQQRDINQSIANLGGALGLTPVIVDGFQHSYPPLLCDRIVFQLEPGWVIRVSTRADLLQRCDPDDAPTADRPGADATPTPIPGGAPGADGLPELSDPYDPATDDNGDTYVPPFFPPGSGGGGFPSPDNDGRYRCSGGGIVKGNGGSYADPQRSYVRFPPGAGVFLLDSTPANTAPGSFARLSFAAITDFSIEGNSAGSPALSGGQAEWDAAGLNGIFALQAGWSFECNA